MITLGLVCLGYLLVYLGAAWLVECGPLSWERRQQRMARRYQRREQRVQRVMARYHASLN